MVDNDFKERFKGRIQVIGKEGILGTIGQDGPTDTVIHYNAFNGAPNNVENNVTFGKNNANQGVTLAPVKAPGRLRPIKPRTKTATITAVDNNATTTNTSAINNNTNTTVGSINQQKPKNSQNSLLSNQPKVFMPPPYPNPLMFNQYAPAPYMIPQYPVVNPVNTTNNNISNLSANDNQSNSQMNITNNTSTNNGVIMNPYNPYIPMNMNMNMNMQPIIAMPMYNYQMMVPNQQNNAIPNCINPRPQQLSRPKLRPISSQSRVNKSNISATNNLNNLSNISRTRISSAAHSRTRIVDYKPYTLKEYKELEKVGIVLGGLGPNIGTKEWEEKKEKMKKMEAYAKNISSLKGNNLKKRKEKVEVVIERERKKKIDNSIRKRCYEYGNLVRPVKPRTANPSYRSGYSDGTSTNTIISDASQLQKKYEKFREKLPPKMPIPFEKKKTPVEGKVYKKAAVDDDPNEFDEYFNQDIKELNNDSLDGLDDNNYNKLKPKDKIVLHTEDKVVSYKAKNNVLHNIDNNDDCSSNVDIYSNRACTNSNINTLRNNLNANAHNNDLSGNPKENNPNHKINTNANLIENLVSNAGSDKDEEDLLNLLNAREVYKNKISQISPPT